MTVDVLILNSGEWVLCEELAASPWHVLIYRQRGEMRNELHLWLPRQTTRGSGDFAFKRYWVSRSVRWCVEIPVDPERPRGIGRSGRTRLRFSSPEGQVLWAEHRGGRGLGDLSEGDLRRLLDSARTGLFTEV